MKSVEGMRTSILSIDAWQLVSLSIACVAFLANCVEVLRGSGFVANTISEESTSPIATQIAFVSFVYFAALIAGLASDLGHGITRLMLAVVRIGAASSAACVFAMIVLGYLSPASFIAHGCNLLLWLIVELSPRVSASSYRVSVSICSAIAVATAALFVASIESKRLQKEQAEFEQFKKTASKQSPKSKKETSLPLSADKSDSAMPRRLNNSRTTLAASDQLHRKGAANARAKFVVYYDYENDKSRQVDRAIRELLARYPDAVSLIARHFPASAIGNTPIESSVRPELCELNLMAETAWMLKGEEGYWQMHHWLLNCEGEIGEAEKRDAFAAIGIERNEFETAVSQQDCLARIVSDIFDARSRGIQNAPAVLLNGQRLTELDAGALERAAQSAIETIATSSGNKDHSSSKSIDPSALDSFPREQQLAAALATVRILNPGGKSTGSGIIFASRGSFMYALSAWHLVTNSKTVEVQTFSEASYPSPAKTYSWATVVAASEAADLAVIRFPTRSDAPAQLRLVPDYKNSGKIEFEALTTGCDGMLSPPTCQANRVLAARNLRRNNSAKAASMWETQKLSVAGRSGGALLDANGFIVGIASGNSDGKGYFCQAEEIYKFLSEIGLDNLLD